MTYANIRMEPEPGGQEAGRDEVEGLEREAPAPDEPGPEAPLDTPAIPQIEMIPGEAPIDPGRTILVVEDDLDTADSLKVKLEARGYNVLIVFDGLQGLETARKLKPALIVLDVMVPGLMGYHVCRLLKFDERFRKIPIIILTGKVDKDSREISTKAGADLYMTKPFDLDAFMGEVVKFIG